MKENELKERFKELLRSYVKVEDIQLDRTLDEMGMDSFAGVHLLVDLESEFEIEFPDYMINSEMFKDGNSIYKCFYDVMKMNDKVLD